MEKNANEIIKIKRSIEIPHVTNFRDIGGYSVKGEKP